MLNPLNFDAKDLFRTFELLLGQVRTSSTRPNNPRRPASDWSRSFQAVHEAPSNVLESGQYTLSGVQVAALHQYEAGMQGRNHENVTRRALDCHCFVLADTCRMVRLSRRLRPRVQRVRPVRW